ncbi:hypothetical protein OKR38_18600 [Clostridioides difficile]|nr:hypothetical protein [Clostridioides difficile]
MLSEKIKPNLESSNLINSIPYFKSKYSDLCGLDDIFLKNQLHMAENNNEIIKMARGEGRKEILESIIEPCNLIFDWGQKSMHSLLDSSEIRKFLEPDGIDKELMFDLLELSEESLLYHTNKYNKKSCGIKSVIDKINKAILRAESQSDLIIIKEWLCYMLHTAGHNEFKKISPWVSVSTGKKNIM